MSTNSASSFKETRYRFRELLLSCSDNEVSVFCPCERITPVVRVHLKLTKARCTYGLGKGFLIELKDALRRYCG
jgi:hypothetical protein